MYDVVTIGDAFQDLFVFSDNFKVLRDPSFKSGKSLSVDYSAKIDAKEIQYHCGGSAINTSISFSKSELKTAIITFFGNDLSSEKIKNEIEDFGVITELSNNDDKPTNTSIILSHNGDRTIITYRGARKFNDLKLAKTLKTNWFYLSPIGKESESLENRLVENIAKNGSGLIWNPGSWQIKSGAKSNKHLLQLCNTIILNREEAIDFSQIGNSKIEECLKALHDFGIKLIVITDGKNGAKAYDGSVFYQIDSSSDERVDATGAGDSFASGLSSKIIIETTGKPQKFFPSRETIIEGLKWGIVNSGSVVGHVGANTGLLTKSEIADKVANLTKFDVKVYS
jgi:sugar/nucleoside kinase (ribokinase family)